jgi:tetratricopeptide (TPR) repeat protein
VKSNSRGEAHPDPASIERFMSGDVTPGEGRVILTHLLGDCAVCRAIAGPLAPFGRTAMLETEEEQVEVTGHDASSVALLERVRERQKAIEDERKEAPNLLAELEAQEQPHRLLLVRNSGRFRTWGVAELLLEESFRHRYNDAEHTRQLAELGVEVADRLDPLVYGATAVNDLRARAWGMQGNALRLRCELREAGRSLTRALKLLEEGSGDPVEEGRVCEFTAALRSNQRRVEQALRLQERAIRLYRRAGQRQRLGMAMVDLASYNALSGDRERAIEIVQQALELVDEASEPHTVLAARHNLAVFLQESGRVREALAVLARARSLYDELGDRRNLLRLRWLEGSLARDVGEIGLAEEAFEEAYRGFVDETPLAAAQVALELAQLLLDTGREAEVTPIVLGIEQVFRAHGITEDALTAWLMLREAIERQTLHHALIKDVAARLQVVRDRPQS